MICHTISFFSLLIFLLSLRYGTTSSIFPPYNVLNTLMLGNKVESLREALKSSDPPQVIVIPSDSSPITDQKDIVESSKKKIEILKEIGLWFL